MLMIDYGIIDLRPKSLRSNLVYPCYPYMSCFIILSRKSNQFLCFNRLLREILLKLSISFYSPLTSSSYVLCVWLVIILAEIFFT